MSTNKENYKKALNFGLLFYAIFVGLSGTISFAVLLFWVVPKDQISTILVPLLFIALFSMVLVLYLYLFVQKSIKNE